MTADCPCGSGSGYAECCGVYHAGRSAPDAQALMRSRYSAYVLCLADYLLTTWHASTRPAELDLRSTTPRWLGLRVRQVVDIDVDHATVEFIARHLLNGRQHRLHEVSRFVREAGVWYYVDGDCSET